MPRAPAGAVRLAASELPDTLKTFSHAGIGQAFSIIPASRRLAIAFPADGVELEASRLADGSPAPVVVKLMGGTPPFRLMAEGKPVENASRRRQLLWKPQGDGTTRLTVVDAEGQARSIEVVVR